MRLPLIHVSALLLVLAACDGAAGDDGVGVDTRVDTSVDTSVAPDTTQDVAADADAPPPAFELGINPAGTNTPEHFSVLNEGDPLEVELGTQGSWMVVLAFRTRGIFDSGMLLNGMISVDGVELGSLILGNQTLAPGGDGFGYYYNFFLVVTDARDIAGKTGVINFLASQGEEQRVEIVREVQLTGGE